MLLHISPSESIFLFCHILKPVVTWFFKLFFLYFNIFLFFVHYWLDLQPISICDNAPQNVTLPPDHQTLTSASWGHVQKYLHEITQDLHILLTGQWHRNRSTVKEKSPQEKKRLWDSVRQYWQVHQKLLDTCLYCSLSVFDQGIIPYYQLKGLYSITVPPRVRHTIHSSLVAFNRHDF